MLLFLVFVHETVHETVHEVANLGLKYRFFECPPLFDRPIISVERNLPVSSAIIDNLPEEGIYI